MGTSKWRKYPKIELHRHMEGSIRLETLIDSAQQVGVELPDLPLSELAKHLLVLEPTKDLTTALNKFWTIQKILATPEVVERVAYENCIDAAGDGIRVLELRYSPGFISLNHPELRYEVILSAIKSGIQKAQAEIAGHFLVGLILVISRDVSEDEAVKTMNFAVKYASDHIGFDLAGDEVFKRPREFKKYFQQAKGAGLGITVHSGEARVDESPEWVRESIDELGATRIGHGVRIVDNPAVMKYVVERNITLEVCPTSNVLTHAADSIASHPIRKLVDSGVKVSINSDDPHLFGIDLTHEYEVLEKTLGFTKKDFDRFRQNAIDASFFKDKSKLKEILEA